MAEQLFPWIPAELEQRITGLLSPNEIACNVRLVNKAAAACYRGPQRTIVLLSQPVPYHALKHRCEANGRQWLKTLSIKRRRELLCLTVTSGDLVNLDLAVGAVGLLLGDEEMQAATAAGHIHVCEWLLQRGCRIININLELAAETGRQDVCEWLLAHRPPLDVDEFDDYDHLRQALRVAACCGHLGLVAWLEQLLPPGETAAGDSLFITFLVHSCDLPTLQRYYSACAAEGRRWQQQQQQQQQQHHQDQQGVPGPDTGDEQQQPQQQQEQQGEVGQEELADVDDKEEILAAACRSPTPDALKMIVWLEAQGCDRTGHLGCVGNDAGGLPDEQAVARLRWLWARGYELDQAAVKEAARKGNVAAMQFLMEEVGVEVEAWYSDPAREAAMGGHLAALQLLHAHGCPLDPAKCLSHSAWNGHTHIASWLADTFGTSVEDLQELVVQPAVCSGSMELLDWLVERGCDFTAQDRILTHAAQGGCEVMMERLLELGCRWPDTCAPYSVAACQGDLAILRCLHRLGCPWGPDAIPKAVRAGAKVPALRWLVEAGCPVDWAEALEAARGMRDDKLAEGVVAWLRDGLRRSRSRRGG